MTLISHAVTAAIGNRLHRAGQNEPQKKRQHAPGTHRVLRLRPRRASRPGVLDWLIGTVHLYRPWVVGLLAVSVWCALPLAALATMATWTQVQGVSFRGEPTEILGPFVVFHIGGGNGRRVLLRSFSPEDCRRIRAEIAALPPRAARFSDAQGYATRELVGQVLRLRNRHLVPAELTDRLEPELLLVLSGLFELEEGRFMNTNLYRFCQRVQRLYPGQMETVFLNAHPDLDHLQGIATSTGMPWLLARMQAPWKMPVLRRFQVAEEGAQVVLITRHGVRLVAGETRDVESVRSLLDKLTELLWQIDPANPLGWGDRLHYLNAIRQAEFARSQTGPVMVGDPLRRDTLRRYGIKQVAAHLAVAPDGKVTPTLTGACADLPSEFVASLSDALSRVVMAPALDQGRPVNGTFDYVLEVPAADPSLEAERAWIKSTAYPELAITDWLVLRPIDVPAHDFSSSVVDELTDGTLVLNTYEVSSGKVPQRIQKSAFNDDWFKAAGAASVQPRAGDRQQIGDKIVLTWERIRSRSGSVDMQTGIRRDYAVGYAWAEFDAPRETDAWLGLGSDDGVKIWLNGELVHDKWIRRPSLVDDDVIPMRLRQGTNRILIKIQNVRFNWSFMYRLRLKG